MIWLTVFSLKNVLPLWDQITYWWQERNAVLPLLDILFLETRIILLPFGLSPSPSLLQFPPPSVPPFPTLPLELLLQAKFPEGPRLLLIIWWLLTIQYVLMCWLNNLYTFVCWFNTSLDFKGEIKTKIWMLPCVFQSYHRYPFKFTIHNMVYRVKLQSWVWIAGKCRSIMS